jgi:hypothetical protein
MFKAKNTMSQAVVADKFLKIGRNLAWMGAVLFAGMAVGLEIFRQLRRMAMKRRDDDDYNDRDRHRSGHTLR